MARGPRCANPSCGKRSTGHQRSMQHRTLSLANCEAVRACMIAELGDEEGQLAAALEVDAKVCVECWPAESLQLINDVLDARVAFLREDGLVFGRCAGLRIPGSWKRPHGQCGGRGAYLADIIKAPPDGVKLFEVQLDGAYYYELHSFDECRAARRLHDAVDAVVRTDVEKERKRVHKVADGKRKRVCTENLAQLNVLGGALTDNEAELAAALNEIASLKAIGPDSTFTLGHFTREFFLMKVNTSLFLSMTGFDDWDMAQVFFDTWFEQFAHEKIGKLSAFQWFVITSWIMRVDVPHEFLIRFTGESSGTISMTCFRWAKRMERRAAHSFIGVPDIALLLDSVPQCHVDNGMGNCVGFGDGVDVTTDSVRVHSRVNQMQHSAKLNTSAARAVALATGGGHVMGVSPMALARATEGALLNTPELQSALKKIPPSASLGFDKGEQNMQSLCPNLNHCFVPTVVDGRAKGGKLNTQTGGHSRGVAENRYSIEVVMRGAKIYRLLRGRVGRARFRWIQPTWIWACGVHNVVHTILRIPHEGSQYWTRHHPIYGCAQSKWADRREKARKKQKRST